MDWDYPIDWLIIPGSASHFSIFPVACYIEPREMETEKEEGVFRSRWCLCRDPVCVCVYVEGGGELCVCVCVPCGG